VERLTTAVRRQKKLLKMVEETQKTVLLVSYEKLMSDPLRACREILNFLVPDIAPRIDVNAVWEKTLADQKLYRSQAERTRHRQPAEEIKAIEGPQDAQVDRKRSARRPTPSNNRGRKGAAKTAR
jgi:hypothetical protein